jgi:hypothetical protein
MKRQQDLAIANSRPKGGNESRPDHHYLKTLENLLKNQWDAYPPDWFITIQWSPAPYEFQVASGHAKHFRNKLLCAIYACALTNLPPKQDRCKLVWFHERAQDPQGRLIYHSHLHLTSTPLITSGLHLQWIIDTKVAPGFQCLKNLHRKHDPGLVIRHWNYDHHAFYNLKDFNRHKYQQDSDLVLDVLISDLIPSK